MRLDPRTFLISERSEATNACSISATSLERSAPTSANAASMRFFAAAVRASFCDLAAAMPATSLRNCASASSPDAAPTALSEVELTVPIVAWVVANSTFAWSTSSETSPSCLLSRCTPYSRHRCANRVASRTALPRRCAPRRAAISAAASAALSRPLAVGAGPHKLLLSLRCNCAGSHANAVLEEFRTCSKSAAAWSSSAA
mmetsp:Transcript_86926/g.243605  ORF Transcript_86926/g.243605 Transcript_86926/m.243605 type:complete len:201 (+) Transcript_86926:137-739(+)